MHRHLLDGKTQHKDDMSKNISNKCNVAAGVGGEKLTVWLLFHELSLAIDNTQDEER